MLKAGADKTSVNTAAIKNPELIRQGAEKFGSQCIVLAVDARRSGEASWEVYINGGRTPTGLDCLEWVKKAVALGAGEILLTSMLQFAVWTALTNMGLGVNLQHYNPLIDAAVKEYFQVPDSWQLVSQMPFGEILEPPKAIEKLPVAERVRVFR